MDSATVEMNPASVPALAKPGAAFAPTNRVTPRSAASDEEAPIMHLKERRDSPAGQLHALLDAIDVNQDGMYVGV